MRIRVDGREYPVVDHRSGAKLLHLVELREHTRRLLEEPLGMGRLDEMTRVARELARDVKAAEHEHAIAVEREAPADELEDLANRVRRLKGAQADDGLLGLAIIVFLSRRAAGDRVTFAQATTIDVGAIEWIEEPGDTAVVPPEVDDDADPFAPDPTAPGDTGAPGSPVTSDAGPARPRAAAKGKRPAKGGRSTTSRSR